MLESEAKTKRCPMPMGVMHDERVQNLCIGSACMMWDPWSLVMDTYPANLDLYLKQGWVEAKDQSYVRKGYTRLVHKPWGDCGLKPKECNCGS